MGFICCLMVSGIFLILSCSFGGFLQVEFQIVNTNISFLLVSEFDLLM